MQKVYADYKYYENEYMSGLNPLIEDDDAFAYWEKKARQEIDLMTFNRIRKMGEIPDCVKECACEVAEYLYKGDKLDSQSLENGTPGMLVSYSNDGQSGTYDVSQSLYTAAARKGEISRIIRKHLLHTGLMYKGVRVYES